jgi:indolepyruvate ferredoxin oxidoreductase
MARRIVLPEDFEMPSGGLNIRWPDPPLDQEMRLHRYAVKAAQAFARANGIDKVVMDAPRARLGIVTTGKSYLDVLQALEYLGLDEAACADIGIRVYKVGMTWPLEPQGIARFAQGLEDIIVVEEKRAFIERQMKEQFFNWPASWGQRPSIVGKYDESGEWILPSTGELTPATIAGVIGRRIQKFFNNESIEQRLQWMQEKEAELALPRASFPRVPHYCSGCPHNTSTNVPEGSRALAGIGCHYMVTWMDRSTDTFTHMGGEGVTWAGQAPFTDTPHVFQNLGDGTYFHSGSLAIRQAVAAGVNITYKILYNDAVAMTGGQPVDGPLSVPDIAADARRRHPHHRGAVGQHRQVDRPARALPQRRRVPRPQRAGRGAEAPARSEGRFDPDLRPDLRHREAPPPQARQAGRSAEAGADQLAGLRRLRRLRQEELLRVGAAEGNRVRAQARDRPVQLQQGLFLRERLLPELRHRARRPAAQGQQARCLHAAGQPAGTAIRGTLEQPWNILITGVGGTGVVTIGALLGMAGHLEGKGATVLDQTGLAQKGGAVTTHIRIARRPTTSTPCASPPARPTWCWAATWWWSTTTGRCRRCAPAVRRWC